MTQTEGENNRLDDSSGSRGYLSERMDMSHNIMASLLLFDSGDLELLRIEVLYTQCQQIVSLEGMGGLTRLAFISSMA